MYISQIDTNSFCSTNISLLKPFAQKNAGTKIIKKAAQQKNINNNQIIPLSRNTLQKNSTLKSLKYPAQEDEAKGVVIGMTMTNAFVAGACAQFPIADEVALGSVEFLMGMKIIKGIYGFKFSEAMIKSIMMSIKATVVGKVAAKAASKCLTWIPGIGNAINAAVAGYTTKAFGYALIKECERIQAELDRGKKIDDILNGNK